MSVSSRKFLGFFISISSNSPSLTFTCFLSIPDEERESYLVEFKEFIGGWNGSGQYDGVNMDHYYDKLLEFYKIQAQEELCDEGEFEQQVNVVTTVEEVIEIIKNYKRRPAKERLVLKKRRDIYEDK